MLVVRQVVDVVDLLQKHADSFETIGDLAHDQRQLDTADLLEIGELRHFHTVDPDFPAQTPGAQRR